MLGDPQKPGYITDPCTCVLQNVNMEYLHALARVDMREVGLVKEKCYDMAVDWFSVIFERSIFYGTVGYTDGINDTPVFTKSCLVILVPESVDYLDTLHTFFPPIEGPVDVVLFGNPCACGGPPFKIERQKKFKIGLSRGFRLDVKSGAVSFILSDTTISCSLPSCKQRRRTSK